MYEPPPPTAARGRRSPWLSTLLSMLLLVPIMAVLIPVPVMHYARGELVGVAVVVVYGGLTIWRGRALQRWQQLRADRPSANLIALYWTMTVLLLLAVLPVLYRARQLWGGV